MNQSSQGFCPGCGGKFDLVEGSTHRYMTSSPGCWQAYGLVLAREYSNPALLAVHRLSVDAYAVQHPGNGSRQAIQSVGLHLARLMLQLQGAHTPEEANNVMLVLGEHKASLPLLHPPSSFEVNVSDVVPAVSPDAHAVAVRGWANSAWQAWSQHHAFIRDWVAQHAART